MNVIMMKSFVHKNLSYKNWLVYKHNQRNFGKYSRYFRGVIYDLGCGDMPYKDFFLKTGAKYIGVDWANSYHDIKADIIADLNKALPINDSVADTIVSISVLEHLCEPQVMLMEAFRILKSGGVIIIQSPWQWWLHEAPYDFFRYSPYGLNYLLKKAGFKEIEVEASSGFFSMWFLKFNYFTSRYIIGPKPIRLLLTMFWVPIWCFLQFLALHLDKLDRDWTLETGGYWVVAKK